MSVVNSKVDCDLTNISTRQTMQGINQEAIDKSFPYHSSSHMFVLVGDESLCRIRIPYLPYDSR
jgi:hypothetical protein